MLDLTADDRRLQGPRRRRRRLTALIRDERPTILGSRAYRRVCAALGGMPDPCEAPASARRA